MSFVCSEYVHTIKGQKDTSSFGFVLQVIRPVKNFQHTESMLGFLEEPNINTFIQAKKPNIAVLFYSILFTHRFHLTNQIQQLNTNESRTKTKVQ